MTDSHRHWGDYSSNKFDFFFFHIGFSNFMVRVISDILLELVSIVYDKSGLFDFVLGEG